MPPAHLVLLLGLVLLLVVVPPQVVRVGRGREGGSTRGEAGDVRCGRMPSFLDLPSPAPPAYLRADRKKGISTSGH